MEHNAEPRHLYQEIGEVDLPYLLYNGKTQPIILMHATGFLPWLWHPIARKLCAEHRVIAPYFCDHRIFEPDQGGLDWMIIARDLATFCKKLNIESPYLVGHSMGATVLTIAHATFGLRSKGLILIEPIFLPRDFYRTQIKVEQHPLAAKSIRRRDSWKHKQDALNYLTSKQLFKKWDKEMLDLYIDHGMNESQNGGLQLACSPKREAALFMGGVNYDPWPILKNVSCPTLILEGEISENRSYIDLKKAAGMIANCSYKMVAGAGHLIPMEKPQEVTEIINEFFQLECR